MCKRKLLWRSEEEVLKDPAIDPTMEGLCLRLMGCFMSGTACDGTCHMTILSH